MVHMPITSIYPDNAPRALLSNIVYIDSHNIPNTIASLVRPRGSRQAIFIRRRWIRRGSAEVFSISYDSWNINENYEHNIALAGRFSRPKEQKTEDGGQKAAKC